ncbi:MAG TPA: low affinity iron permease family protein [Gemmatimonadales bacterium]|nr:low affinity iron permease family protein [Gemmatimonadales bacterium]
MAFSDWFSNFAKATSRATGRPTTFALAALVVLAWAVTGPMFHYSDTWQLVINTGTTIVTFLMVFLIQNTQNRDATAMQLKLDELIRAMKGAEDAALSLEDLTDEDLARVKAAYDRLAARARAQGLDGGDAGARQAQLDGTEVETTLQDVQSTAAEASAAAQVAGETADVAAASAEGIRAWAETAKRELKQSRRKDA